MTFVKICHLYMYAQYLFKLKSHFKNALFEGGGCLSEGLEKGSMGTWIGVRIAELHSLLRLYECLVSLSILIMFLIKFEYSFAM